MHASNPRPAIWLRRSIVLIVLILAASLVERPSSAFASFRFDIRDVLSQCTAVMAGDLRAVGNQKFTFIRKRTLKGRAADTFEFELDVNSKAGRRNAVKALARVDVRPAVLILAQIESQKESKGQESIEFGHLHVNGHWLEVVRNGDRLLISGTAPLHYKAFSGGTEMLVRMCDYVLTDPEHATVPVSVGTRWMDSTRVTQMSGEITGMVAVGHPKPWLFVGSPKGDRVFASVEDEGFKEVTESARVDSCSKRFVWADMNADRIPDLITWDGTAIMLRQGRYQELAPVDADYTFPFDGPCLGLSVLSCRAMGSPGVLVSTPGQPFILKWATNGWHKVALPRWDADERTETGASACVVADLDNDGHADILQPRTAGGVLWRGKHGGFARPKRSDVRNEGATSRSAIGDFDGDGALDLFIAGPKGNELWENDGNGGFDPVIRFAGSLSWKTQVGASGCLSTDLNHDGRSDLCLLNRKTVRNKAPFAYHFNRGFRSFREEGELGLPLPDTGQTDQWPVSCMAGDFNADASLDLVVSFSDGTVRAFFNDLLELPVLIVRLPPGKTGPLTVQVWQGKKHPVCVGTHVVTGFKPGTLVPLRDSGTCTLKWQMPGKRDAQMTVDVQDRAKTVVLRDTSGT